MKNVRIYWWAVVILGALSFVSCEEEEVVVMSKAEKKLVDSIYRRDVSYIRKKADAKCDQNFPEYFEYFVDSIKQSYIDDVNDLVEYLKSNQ